jgi:hypothetical protein
MEEVEARVLQWGHAVGTEATVEAQLTLTEELPGKICMVVQVGVGAKQEDLVGMGDLV